MVYIFTVPEPPESLWLYIDYDLLIDSIDYSNKDVSYARFVLTEFPELREIVHNNYSEHRKKNNYFNKGIKSPKIMKKPKKREFIKLLDINN